MKSLGQKLKQLAGLVGTSDVSEWEAGFLKSVLDRSIQGEDTTRLTEKQVAVVERIHAKHFA